MAVWIIRVMINSLLFTILLEEVFAFAVGIRDKRDLILLGMVNVLTNPAVVFMYYLITNYTSINAAFVTIILELAAVLVEACYFKKYAATIHHPLIFSVGVNTFSYIAGIIISLFI